MNQRKLAIIGLLLLLIGVGMMLWAGGMPVHWWQGLGAVVMLVSFGWVFTPGITGRRLCPQRH